MPVSRRTLLLTTWLTAFLFSAKSHAAGEAAPAVIQHFYAELVAVMKAARQLRFDERYKRLAPTVLHTFNLALMSRLAVGPDWAKLRPDQQQRISDAFARYTISTYASRFDDFNGERFDVEPAPVPNANGSLVKTQLVKTNGERVSL